MTTCTIGAEVAARAIEEACARPMDFGLLWRRLHETAGVDAQPALHWLIGKEVPETAAAGLAAATITLGVEDDVSYYWAQARRIRESDLFARLAASRVEP